VEDALDDGLMDLGGEVGASASVVAEGVAIASSGC